MRFSLFTKILLWFFLNLLVLAVVFVLFLNQQLPEMMRWFSGSTGLRAVAQLITEEVREKGADERDATLQRFSAAYQVDFLLYTARGEKIAGKELVVPPAVIEQIKAPPPRRPGPLPGAPPTGGPLPPGRGGPPGLPFPIFEMQTSDPLLYWKLVRLPPIEYRQEELRAVLLAVSPSRSGNGLFFDPKPWLLLVGTVLALSILLWLPFVRRLTKVIRQMTTATEQIAEEQFDVRVDEQRGDEIGRLGKAINHLATRLSGFVHGQKRFLGDISHELNSPLARMQFALSILENRVDAQHRAYVSDVQEEVQLMSRLVSELLAYSKAGIRQTEIKLEAVPLQPLVQHVIAREAAHHPAIANEVAAEIAALAHPELLARAVGNVIRNAVRYAGPAVPITVRAQQQGQQVKIRIADGGTGVPEEALSQLFDPFYRLEPDRARNTGGTGLGLAIVKTCVEACQGTVTAKNRTPNGLEVLITLQAVPLS